MAVDIKVAPDEKLELVQTYITDTNSNSDYFNISELPETFSGGKNAFLLAGSDKLLANTEIKIQIRDSEGKVCYIEYSNGSPEYYEGNSKVVAVYVYPNTTAFGPATITILGQLKDVPQEWNGLYSVKWTKQININPALANTTRVRFYKRPQVSITEIVEPLYTIVSGSKTPSLIQGSFASIKVNQLETFAGDVKRIKVYRTALGDISDYDLIQDILVESKNLLTTYELSGSVVGDGGVFTNDSLSKLWLTGSLYGALNSTYINDGLQLTGSGNLTYSTSLNLLSSNTYELQLDSFFTGSTANNLGIYVSYPTQSTLGQPYTSTTPIAILNGTTPTKNFGTQTFPFNVPFDYPTASLYLSQSSGTTQWHIGNVSLNVSQDTAFSPNEISFVTSMPTVLTNETFNFKFEFYDVNNNYVPVAVTQSAVFVGGTNFNTLQSGSLYASASVSASLAALSQSVSGTISLTSQSLSSSISKSASDTSASSANFIILVSGSLSSSINVVSGSVYILSASVSSSIGNLSSSLLNFSSSQSSQSLYQVYSASAFLDKFIFTDETGKLNSPPTASGNGLYLGSTYLGYYSQSVWRTYMDDQGDFYLTGSNNNFLAWSGQLGTLQVQGVINIQGGNAATTTSVADVYSSASAYSSSAYTSISASNAAAAAYSASLMSSSLYISASLNSGISGSSYNATLWSASLASSSLFYSGALSARAEAISSSTAFTTNLLDGRIFTDVSGNINKPPNVMVGTSNGLFLGNTHLGFYSGSTWRTYMDNQGKFYLTGSASEATPFSNYLVWDGAGELTVAGNINIVGSNSNIYTQTEINTISSSISASAYRAYLSASAYSSSLSTTITTNSGSTLTSISASNAASLAYSASISASTAATTALLDGRIFTDANGRVVKAPAASVAGLFLGNTHLGFYDGSGTWKTYMDNQGKFYLTGSVTTPFSNYLVWDGAGGLTIAGSINITGGNGATQDYAGSTASGSLTTATTRLNVSASALQSNLNTSASALQSNLNTSASALQSNITGVDDKVFTNALGRITKVPTSGSTAGLYLGSTNLGYYNGTSWRTYMDNTGLFYLTGSADGNALLWNGNTLTIKGTIKVSDGTEVTPTVITNANSALQSGQTGKSLGLTGGSIGGVTIAPTKIYVGTGTYGNANTGFYVDSDGNMSLKDKLTWDNANSTLSITGTVVITGGATKTAIDDAGALALVAKNSASSAQTTADGKVAPSQVTSHIGGQNVTTIDGGKISALSFSGKTAVFDQGSVGGWTMDGTGLYKTSGSYTLRMGANAQRISISQANVVDTIDRVRLDSSTDIPAIIVSDTGSLRWDAAGQTLLTVYDTSDPNYTQINTDFDPPDGSPSHPAVSGVYGIVGLVYAAEEIFVESESFPNIDNTISGQAAFMGEYGSSEVAGYYNVTLRVRKFPTDTDALNQTNADATYGDRQALVAYKEFRNNQMDPDRNLDKVEVYGATMPADGPGGINTPAPGGAGNWYRVELRQIWQLQAVTSIDQNAEAYISARRPADNIFVKFGRVSNGYSVFSPGGLQVYQGVRNYMNASLPSGSTGDAANFFIVKGKSQIIGSLNVTSGFSANSKQFKIQHPLNENKWLYHTSTESPRADLIYRGTLQLQSGVGSASIDSASNMTNGTFNALTKNPQLFLQNNESFDRIKGYVQSGSVYVLSENQNSTASIDWSVIAERKDTEMLKSPLYDRNGKYKTENYKGEYLEATRSERFLNYSGSI